MIRNFLPVGLLTSVVIFVVPLQAQRQHGVTDVQVHVRFEDSRPAGEQIKVEIANASGIPMSQAFTDSSGRAVLEVTSAGGYILKASGTNIKDGASESIQVFDCPARVCTATAYLHVKAKEETTTESTEKSGQAAVTSAAALLVPDSARKAFEQGLKAWQKQDYQKAAEKFEKAVADYPKYDTAYNNLGVMYAHLGENDKSLAAFKRSVELNDKNADADRNLARLLIRQKDYAQAEELLNKALAVQAPDAATLTMLAIAEIQSGKPADALKNAQKVHTLPHDGYSIVHYIAGEALEETRHDSEATAEYALYLKEAPSGPQAAQVKDALQRLAASNAPTPTQAQ